jgi:hypothetical protein
VTPLLWFLAIVGVFCSGFFAWRDADDARLKLEELSRPLFVPEITKVTVEGVHARRDLVKLYVFMTIRNRGAGSSIGGWQLKVVPPQPATPYLQTADGYLSRSAEGNNLLLVTKIQKNESISGWLLCEGPSDRLGLQVEQRPAVQVLFNDVYDRTYSAVYPPNFKSDFFS